MSDTPAKTRLDFLVIGAQKAGTTSLFEYLRRHPEVYLPPGKEVPYFSDDGMVAHGWDSYLTQTFAGADPARRWGTASPQYMAGAVLAPAAPVEGAPELAVPGRIQARLPEVRLVAILRDPVARAASHHRMMWLRGEETRTFEQAVDEQLRPQALEATRTAPTPTSAYVAWGEYGRILAGYLELFPTEQLLVIYTEDLEQRPVEVLAEVHRHLGVEADVVPDNLDRRFRVGAAEQRLGGVSPESLRRRARRSGALRGAWGRLPRGARHGLYNGFEKVTYRFDLWNRKATTEEPGQAPAAAIEERLREHFAADAELLRAQLGAPPPWVNGRSPRP
jgi:hypothetical protein